MLNLLNIFFLILILKKHFHQFKKFQKLIILYSNNTGVDWLVLIPPTLVVAGFTYMSYLAFCPSCRKRMCGSDKVNHLIKKSTAKVVDQVDVEDIVDKAAGSC